MSLTSLAKRFESIAATVSIGGRTLLGLDTNPVPSDWTHITKVDPEAEKKLPLLFPVYLSESSAVSVGGSRDITERNTEETFELITDSGTPAFHEPSAPTHVTEQTREQAAFLAVPEVLNGDSQALVGTLGEGLEYVREELGPTLIEEKSGFSVAGLLGDRGSDFIASWMMNEAVFEAYIIMNEDSAAAREANVTESNLLTPKQAKQRALAAQHHLDSEIIYLEYSGTFGGEEAVEILEAIDDSVSWSQIWYGGGLDSRENVNSVRNAGADAVVVGNVFHQVAETEAELVAQAREELDTDADSEEIQAWLEENVDIDETAAGRYLSTIPAVTQPSERASEYLTATIEFMLTVDGIAADLDEPGAAAIDRAVRGAELPGTELLGTVEGADQELLEKTATGLLAAKFDVDTEKRLVTRHLAVEL